MLHKFFALFPLLGWYYLTIIGFVIVMAALKRRGVIFLKIYYVVFGIAACVLAIQSLRQEVLLFPKSKVSFTDSYISRIEQTAGTYFSTNFEIFRPKLQSVQLVRALGGSTWEFYYQRMYLYPTQVLETTNIMGNGYYILGKNDLIGFLPSQYTILAQKDGKYLVKIEKQ